MVNLIYLHYYLGRRWFLSVPTVEPTFISFTEVILHDLDIEGTPVYPRSDVSPSYLGDNLWQNIILPHANTVETNLPNLFSPSTTSNSDSYADRSAPVATEMNKYATNGGGK